MRRAFIKFSAASCDIFSEYEFSTPFLPENPKTPE